MRFPDDVPSLTDGSVTLRAHRADDAEGVYEQCIDPVSRRWTTVPVPYSRDDAAAFVGRRGEAWEDDRDWGFAIEAPGGGGPSNFGGSISLGPKGSGIAELAFGAHPGVRGRRGVMSTAVRLIIDWGFAAQGLNTVKWACNAGNYPSWRVAWKIGFGFEGRSRATLPQRGEALDAWHATLLASDSREPKTRWLQPPRLEGGGIVVRDVAETDEQRYLEATTDAAAMKWLGAIPLPRTAAEFRSMHRDRLLQASLGSALRWSVAAEDDTYLGSLNLFGLDGLDYKSGEVGYHAHPDARGRGVMTTALRLVLAHAFAAESASGLGLQRVSLGAASTNPASLGVARSCGFTETGFDRRCYNLPDGSVVDLARFDLLADEFARRQAP